VYADLLDGDLDAVATRLDHAAVSTDVVEMWSSGLDEYPTEAPERARIRMIPGL
jgi:hypothetical protein